MGERELCTGLAATWCPVHGECTCPADTSEPDGVVNRPTFNDDACPLHSFSSNHAGRGFVMGVQERAGLAGEE